MRDAVTSWRRETVKRACALAVLVLALAGCGTAPPPSRVPGTGGYVTVALATAPGSNGSFLAPIHRARLVRADGSVAAEWEVTAAAPPSTELDPGAYRLDVFTVFVGDVIECVTDPAAPGGSRCSQPTLGPAQVCSLDVVLVAGQSTRATYHVLRDGLCGLELGEAPAAT